MYTIENLLAEVLTEDGYAEASDREEMAEIFSEDFMKFADESGLEYWEGAGEFVYELGSKLYPSRFFQGHQLTLVDSWGGEGDGGSFHKFIKWNGRLFQLSGKRSSWDADYWSDDVVEVEPREVVKIEYFPIDK